MVEPLPFFSLPDSDKLRGKAEAFENLAERHTIKTPLDPLLHVLSRDYVNDKDLTLRLRKLFQVSVRLKTCLGADPVTKSPGYCSSLGQLQCVRVCLRACVCGWVSRWVSGQVYK